MNRGGMNDKKLDKLSENNEKSQDQLNEYPSSLSSSLKQKLKVKIKKSKSTEARSFWDPFISYDWDAAGPPGHLTSTRIKRDIASLFKDPLPGIFVIPDEQNYCIVHCLILGPFDSPYEGGFFHFAVRFGPSYPIHPPRVKFLTTDGGNVRFNPNLYENGKVCLSILGTWSGPAWSPALNLGSLLLSIQSLLNEKPYFNEPGFKTEHFRGESDSYNLFLIHETLRTAVCGQMEAILNKGSGKCILPPDFADVIRDSFSDLYDDYIETCNKYQRLDGQVMRSVFYYRPPGKTFSFAKLQERLKAIKEKVDALGTAKKLEKDSSSLSSISDEEGASSPSKDRKGDVAFPIEEKEEETAAAAEAAPAPAPASVEQNPDLAPLEASGMSTVEFSIDEDLQLLMDEEDEDYEEDDDEEDKEAVIPS